MNLKQQCYSLIYHLCLFVGNKKNRVSLRSGRSGYLRLAVRALERNWLSAWLKRALLARRLCFRTAKLFLALNYF